MRIYIASRWRLELRPVLHDLRSFLQDLGHEVTSRWLDCMRPYGEDEQLLHDSVTDLGDVRRAQWLIQYFPPGLNRSRGGNHAEFGMARAWGHKLTLIGEPQHVFHRLPDVERFETIDDFKSSLLDEEPFIVAPGRNAAAWITAFGAWLDARSTPIAVGGGSDSATMAALVAEFCEEQHLPGPRWGESL